MLISDNLLVIRGTKMLGFFMFWVFKKTFEQRQSSCS